MTKEEIIAFTVKMRAWLRSGESSLVLPGESQVRTCAALLSEIVGHWVVDDASKTSRHD